MTVQQRGEWPVMSSCSFCSFSAISFSLICDLMSRNGGPLSIFFPYRYLKIIQLFNICYSSTLETICYHLASSLSLSQANPILLLISECKCVISKWAELTVLYLCVRPHQLLEGDTVASRIGLRSVVSNAEDWRSYLRRQNQHASCHQSTYLKKKKKKKTLSKTAGSEHRCECVCVEYFVFFYHP